MDWGALIGAMWPALLSAAMGFLGMGIGYALQRRRDRDERKAARADQTLEKRLDMYGTLVEKFALLSESAGKEDDKDEDEARRRKLTMHLVTTVQARKHLLHPEDVRPLLTAANGIAAAPSPTGPDGRTPLRAAMNEFNGIVRRRQNELFEEHRERDCSGLSY